jgi:vesicle coat complex subunit
MELITSTDVVRNLCKKMAPPLVTLLSAEPEIQYVALRNINLIVQKRPTILAHEIKVTVFLALLIIRSCQCVPSTQLCIFL